MKKRYFAITALLLLWMAASNSLALPPVGGKTFGIQPISNEISFYKNVDDSGNDRGTTLQIVAINGVNLLTDFTFEFTADLNWDMSEHNHDHYIELSLVKPVWKIVSVNYQRIMIYPKGGKPVNQFGIRLTF